ncbi:MAG: GspE family protein [Acetobacter sp.]|nr:GspE family protein [Acetobacter sp.]
MTKRNEENFELLQYNFSDLYIDRNRDFYISDERYINSLKKVEPLDKELFYEILVEIPHKASSYSMNYKGTFFRIEYVSTISGELYCLRRMPLTVPSIHDLNFDRKFIQHLVSLSSHSGLILWSGATGSGKTTAISSLLAEYLNLQGGFAYTIEDPAEMPLDGVYKAVNGSIGFCKQTEVKKDDWSAPLKSALRSKPRYIFIGEIRTPDSAKECLRASISGHLVLATIHSSSITDALSSLVKYASYNMSEMSAYDILSRGLLCCVKQDLIGTRSERKPHLETLFANPDMNKGCQVRAIIRSGKLNLGTSIEMQAVRMAQGASLF